MEAIDLARSALNQFCSVFFLLLNLTLDFSQVYDVTSFVSRHPGGVDQIMLGAGHDVTQILEAYHCTEVFKYVSIKAHACFNNICTIAIIVVIALHFKLDIWIWLTNSLSRTTKGQPNLGYWLC